MGETRGAFCRINKHLFGRGRDRTDVNAIGPGLFRKRKCRARVSIGSTKEQRYNRGKRSSP